MSGPATSADRAVEPEPSATRRATVEVSPSRVSQVGSLTVRRAIPQRVRRTVGPWCFVDHMGPTIFDAGSGVDVPPHPHIGLQTVTWLLEGEMLHRDSLGTEQIIAPGQLNLMTAGNGVAHSEEDTGSSSGAIHGVQLWVAQPEATRHGAPGFEHHAELPQVAFDHGTVTVLVGDLDGSESPARRDSDHLGIDLALRPGTTTLPLRPDYEYALVVLDGAIQLDNSTIEPSNLAYLGIDRQSLQLSADTSSRAMLLGGIPLEEPILIWWNFVARTRDEISAAYEAWTARSNRFGHVDSSLEPLDVAAPPWVRDHES